MFHPFGGGRKKRPEDMVYSPLSSEERKDSLSVNVAFVQFHISRSRRVNFDHAKGGGGSVDISAWGNSFSGSDLGGGGQLRSLDKDEVGMASVRFNTIGRRKKLPFCK